MSRIIPFRRGSIAYQRNAAGVYVQVAADVPRLDHYTFPGANRNSLFEPRSVNSCLYSDDITHNPQWGFTGGLVGVRNQVGLAGLPNTGTLLTDNIIGARCSWSQQFAVPNDRQPITLSYYLGKDAVNLYRRLGGNISGGRTVVRQVLFNTMTGDSGINQLSVGTGTVETDTKHRVIDGGSHWIVEIVFYNNGSGNNLFAFSGIPCYSATNGSAESNALTGTLIFLQAQVELGRDSSTSPIITAGVPVAREADEQQRTSITVDAPVDLRRDTATGVLFDANDPIQLAAHPNNSVNMKRRAVAGLYDDTATKAASPIAGVVVRNVNNPTKRP